MRENRVDISYLFLHPSFSIVTSLAHTEEIFKKTKSHGRIHERKLSGFAVFVSYCGFSIVASPGHPGERKNA